MNDWLNKRYELLINTVACILLIGYFLIDAFELWNYRIFDFGYTSIGSAFLTVIFWALLVARYRSEITLFELLLIVLVLCLGLTAVRYGANPWYFNFDVYKAWFAIGLGVVLIQKPLKYWAVVIPMLVILCVITINFFVFKETAIDGSIFKFNRNVFAKTVFAVGLLGFLHVFIKKQEVSVGMLFFPVSVLILNIYSMSRAGILVSFYFLVIVLGTFLVMLHRRIIQLQPKYAIRRIVGLYVVSLFTLLLIGLYIFRSSRFAQSGFSSSGRDSIYQNFFRMFTWRSWLVGIKLSDLNRYSNLHNSFFHIIAQSGLLGVLVITVYLRSLWQYLSMKKFVLLFLTSTLFVYSLVERFMFLNLGDIVLFPLVIYSNGLFYRKKSS